MTDEDTQSPFEDPAPGVNVGDFIQAKAWIIDDGVTVAEPGDVGTVILKDFDPVLGWCLPTVKFERTGVLQDVAPEEIDVLAPQDFATRAETTPKKAQRTPIKRGKS